MIGEDDQASTFGMMAEMLHKVRHEQLSSKGAVVLLYWLQSFREECELSVDDHLLLD